MRSDLENLEACYAEEVQALGFCSLFVGVFVSALGTVVAAGLTGIALAAFVGITVASGGLAAQSLVAWLRRKSRRRSLLRDMLGEPE